MSTAIDKFQNMSLLKKMVSFLIPGMGLFCLVLIFAVNMAVENGLEEYFSESLQSKYEAFMRQMENDKIMLINHIAYTPKDLETALLDGSASALNSYYNIVKGGTKVNDVYILDEAGKVLYTSNPALDHSTVFQGMSIYKNINALTIKSGMSQLCYLNNNVSLVAISPISLPVLKGYVVFEEIISQDQTVDNFKAMLDCEVTVFYDDVRIATSIMKDGQRADGTKLNNDVIYNQVYNERKPYYGKNIIQGANYLTVYIPLDFVGDKINALFFIGMPISVIGQTKSLLLRIIIPVLVGISIIIIVLVLIVLIQLMIKPLKIAEKAIHGLSSGDADLTFRINNQHHDEIGRLCRDIDVFLENQQSMIRDLKSAEVKLGTIGENLSTSSVQSASAITEIMANIEGVRKQTNHQSAAINTANNEMENSLDVANKLETLIQDQSAGIIESSASIEQMLGNIASVTQSVQKMNGEFQSLTEVTSEGYKKQTEADKKITEMAAQSQHLVEANTVIARIASQTNLLAMNAAIEAAHAGDAGAGFSVVADEIRSLAENSSRQSKAIGQELKQITDTIQNVVSTSHQSKDAFVLITEKLNVTHGLVSEIDSAMEQQNDTSKEVLAALRDINSSTAEVQEMSKTMQNATQKTHEEMQNLTQITATVSGSMDEMANGVTEINQSAQDVSNMAIETRSNITSMESLIGRFKI